MTRPRPSILMSLFVCLTVIFGSIAAVAETDNPGPGFNFVWTDFTIATSEEIPDEHVVDRFLVRFEDKMTFEQITGINELYNVIPSTRAEVVLDGKTTLKQAALDHLGRKDLAYRIEEYSELSTLQAADLDGETITVPSLLASQLMEDTNLFVLETPPGKTVWEMITLYNGLGEVRYAEPNFIARVIEQEVNRVPNDPSWGQQWGPQKIRCPEAWDILTGGDSVIIAVIDTGINWNHEDMGTAKVIDGVTFGSGPSGGMDDHWHGTHCSGSASATTDNAKGIAGVSWGAKLYAVKFLNSGGSGSYEDAVRAVDWARSKGAHITSNSWGGSSSSAALEEAFNNAHNAGILNIAAAGNSGGSVGYPAKYANVMAVAATDSNDNPASFSSRGPEVDVAAPGVGIYSLSLSGYRNANGTSMACPHVSGQAALLMSYNSDLTNTEVRQIIRNSAEDVGLPSGFGTGRIDVYQSVIDAPSPDPDPPEGWRNFSPTDWTKDPEGSIEVFDAESGLNVTSGGYQYSNDGGSSWNGEWLAAACTGESGTTEYQTVTASAIPFGPDSPTLNKVKFAISDMAGNTGYSSEYTIKLDRTPPTRVMNLDARPGGGGDDIYISWTAPGDASSGTDYYTIRYSLEYITEANWDECEEVADPPVPGSPGSEEGVNVSGLEVATTYYFALKTTDKVGNVAELSNIASSITEPNPVAIVTTSLRPAFAGHPYSAVIETFGGMIPFEFIIVGGSLPGGFSLDPVTGEVSGHPSPGQAGDYSFTVSVVDSWDPPNSDEKELSLNVTTRPLNLESNYLPDVRRGEVYSWTLSATGGVGPYTWSVVSGTLPAGLTLNSETGEISGTPTSGMGTFCFTIRVTDTGSGLTVEERELCLNITDTIHSQEKWAWGENIGWVDFKPQSGPGVTVGSNILAGWVHSENIGWIHLGSGRPESGNQYSNTSDSDYGVNNDGAGNLSGYAWSETAGWIDFNPSGSRVRIDTSDGRFYGYARSENFGWINFASLHPVIYWVRTDLPWDEIGFQRPEPLVVTTENLPEGRVGEGYFTGLSASGGVSPYAWSLASGSLPSGLELGADGSLSGSPTGEGEFVITVRAVDHYGAVAERALTLAVSPGALVLAPSNLPEAVVDLSYNRYLVAYFGIKPYSWSIISGSLPQGMSLDSASGLISGRPGYGSLGVSEFTVMVEDAQTPSDAAYRDFSIEVVMGAELEITTGSLPGGTVGVDYAREVRAAGGAKPYYWSISSGSLPPGLSLNSASGEITGLPEIGSAGTYGFTVRVSDVQIPAAEDEKALSIEITDPEDVMIFTPTLAEGTVGQAYSQAIQATGGVEPYGWSISSGSLPAGLSLDASSGMITGTPEFAGAGEHNLTVRVTDSRTPAGSDEKQFDLTIHYAPIGITTGTLPNGYVDENYNRTLQAQGGKPPYTWSLVSGALPEGLSLSGEGTISGVPDYASQGINEFRVRVTDSQAAEASAEKDLEIEVSIRSFSIISFPPSDGVVYEHYSHQFAAWGGVKPYHWEISAGTLPAGLSLDDSSGVLSGVPTKEQSVNFTVRATDSQSGPASDQRSYTLGMHYQGEGNIDPLNRYSWGENVGWINFRPEMGGVTVYDDRLEGWARSGNLGWVSLRGENYGVANDGDGNLSGYGWSENVGWIAFSPDSAVIARRSESIRTDEAISSLGVKIDEGNFSGYAWSDNVGWINFASDSPVEYRVRTFWGVPEPTPTPTVPPPPSPTPTVPPPPSFEEWIDGYDVGSESGQLDDPDGDNWNNLAEYQFYRMTGRESDPSDPGSGGQAVPLTSGWNLISITVNKCWYDSARTGGIPDSVAGEFEDVAGSPPGWAGVFESIEGEYELILSQAGGDTTFNPEIPHISTLDWIGPDRGFWIRMKEEGMLVLKGSRVERSGEDYPPLPLSAGTEYSGWTLLPFLPGTSFYTVGQGRDVTAPSDHTREMGYGSVSETLGEALNMDGETWDQVERIQVIYPLPLGGVAYQRGLPDSFQSLKFLAPGYGLWIKMDASYPGGYVIYREP